MHVGARLTWIRSNLHQRLIHLSVTFWAEELALPEHNGAKCSVMQRRRAASNVDIGRHCSWKLLASEFEFAGRQE